MLQGVITVWLPVVRFGLVEPGNRVGRFVGCLLRLNALRYLRIGICCLPSLWLSGQRKARDNFESEKWEM